MENMPLALNLTFVGMTVVFIALILLSIIIYFSTRLLNIKKRGSSNENINKDEASILEFDDEDDVIEKTTVSGKTDDEELIAVLMAAIQASMVSESQCKLIIKSFRRIEQSSPVWNRAGRLEQISSKL